MTRRLFLSLAGAAATAPASLAATATPEQVAAAFRPRGYDRKMVERLASKVLSREVHFIPNVFHGVVHYRERAEGYRGRHARAAYDVPYSFEVWDTPTQIQAFEQLSGRGRKLLLDYGVAYVSPNKKRKKRL